MTIYYYYLWLLFMTIIYDLFMTIYDYYLWLLFMTIIYDIIYDYPTDLFIAQPSHASKQTSKPTGAMCYVLCAMCYVALFRINKLLLNIICWFL